MASLPRPWTGLSFALAFALVVSVVGCRDDGASGRAGVDGGRDVGGADRGRDVTGLGACEGQDQPSAEDPSGNTRVCGSVTHRVAKNACPWPPPDDSMVLPATALMDECRRNSDCAAKKRGRCINTTGGGGAAGNTCDYGCDTDQDCTAGNVCRCDREGGSCVPARCATDAECSPGLLCSRRRNECWQGLFDPTDAYDCQSPSDQCASNSDCPDAQECRSSVAGGFGYLTCQPSCPNL